MARYEFIEMVDEARMVSKWKHFDDEDEAYVVVELGPAEITRYGLNDALREALFEDVEARAHDNQGPAKAKPKDKGSFTLSGAGLKSVTLPADAPVQEIVMEPATQALVGGYNDDWRWDYVRDGQDVIVVIDNRPQIDRLAAELQPVPALYQLAAPLELLQHVVRLT